VGTRNDDAWAKVPLWGLVGYVVVLAVVLPMTDGSPLGVAGRLLVPTVVAIGVVVITATSSRRRWGTRTYGIVAPVAVAVLTAGLALVVSLDPAHEREEATAVPRPVEVFGTPTPVSAPTTAEPQSFPTFTAHLTNPGDGANWQQVTDPATLAQDANLAAWTKGLYGIDDVAVGSYVHQLHPADGFRYIGVNGHVSADSREAAGRAALVGTIGTRVASFPPQADGWLGCNGGVAQGSRQISCAWVGDQAAVFLRWADTGMKLGQAASFTRAFRDYVATKG
jgi:hypothetical protein